MIALFSNGDDVHATAVASSLSASGTQHVRVDTERLLDAEVELRLQFEDRREPIARVAIDRTTLDASDITAALYRRPLPPLSRLGVDVGAETFIARETEAAFDGFCVQVPRERWVSSPSSIIAARSKLHQLDVARTLGLTVPETLVTTSPSAARDFVRAHPTGVIVKVLSRSLVQRGQTFSVIRTSLLDSDNIATLDRVRACPTLFQAFIPKASEIRATIIGDEVFGCEIVAGSAGGAIDYRNDLEGCVLRPVEISSIIRARLSAMMHHFHLRYAAVDLIVTPLGEYVFLEMNASGQWLWIEERTGLALTAAVAALLTRISAENSSS